MATPVRTMGTNRKTPLLRFLQNQAVQQYYVDRDGLVGIPSTEDSVLWYEFNSIINDYSLVGKTDEHPAAADAKLHRAGV